MSLRTRLLLAYGYIVALLVVMAAVSLVGVTELGRGIDQVLRENFASVQASVTMLESLERQDSAILHLVLRDVPTSDIEAEEQRFDEALAAARANVTIAGEDELIERLGHAHDAYRRARDRALKDGISTEEYRGEVYPRLKEVQVRVRELLNLNHTAMLEADRSARRDSNRIGFLLRVLVVLSLGSLIVIARALQRNLVDRLDQMSAVLAQVRRGDTHRRFTIDQRDELGRLAELLNESLDRTAEFQNRAAVRRSETRNA